MRIITARQDVESMWIGTLEADPVFVALAAPWDGAPRTTSLILYPNADGPAVTGGVATADPIAIQRPFVQVVCEGAGSTGPGNINIATYALRFNTVQGFGTYQLNRMLRRAQRLFNKATWERPLIGDEDPRTSWFVSRSASFVDEVYGTTVIIARFHLYHG